MGVAGGSMDFESDVWCENCGSQLPRGATQCPHCGTPVSTSPVTVASIVDEKVASIGHTGELAGDTSSMARLESAVPPEPDDGYVSSGSRERLPRRRIVVTAVTAALVFVVGGILIVTKPWDPDAYLTHAMEDFDTSMAGYPGFLEVLTGQDSSRVVTEEDDSGSGDSKYDALLEAYTDLADIAEAADEAALDLDELQAGTSIDVDAVSSQVSALSIRVSNLISNLGQLDMSGTPYEEDQQNIITLANYLRNRLDVMSERCNSEGRVPTGETSDVSWKSMFDANYEGWAPTLSTE